MKKVDLKPGMIVEQEKSYKDLVSQHTGKLFTEHFAQQYLESKEMTFLFLEYMRYESIYYEAIYDGEENVSILDPFIYFVEKVAEIANDQGILPLYTVTDASPEEMLNEVRKWLDVDQEWLLRSL